LSKEEILANLSDNKVVKLYKTKYLFETEKLFMRMSLSVTLLTGSLAYFTNPHLLLKLVNYSVLGLSLLMQFSFYFERVVFITSLEIIEKGKKISITSNRGKNYILSVEKLQKAGDDPRTKHVRFDLTKCIVFTSLEKTCVFQIPLLGDFANEDVLEEIINGKWKN